VALEQRTARAGATSTVATVTEIAHYLRLLYAKLGTPHCPDCDLPVVASSVDEVFARLRRMRGKRSLRAPVVKARKGTYLDVFSTADSAGVQWALVDGKVWPTDQPPKLARSKEHDIDLIIFEGSMRSFNRDHLERALRFGNGQAVLGALPVEPHDPAADELLSTARACAECSRAVPELDPRWFSFNTAQGRCAACEGTGFRGGVRAVREHARAAEEKARALQICPRCEGGRLAPIPRAVRLCGLRYHEHCALSVQRMREHVEAFGFAREQARIAAAPVAELLRRLRFVEQVGLGYLSLERRAQTLSGGEMQRLRLAAQLGAGLTGALYVLDEPTIGLHPRDTQRLLGNLRALVDTGSTVLVVEHDADTIRAADELIDLGPAGGRGGGRIVASGPPAKVLADPSSPTAVALRSEGMIVRETGRRDSEDCPLICLEGVQANNLEIDRLELPSRRMVVVAGVSGSGKSTLVGQVLYPAARRKLGRTSLLPGAHDGLELPPTVQRVIAVDQAPIGRTSRSVPATFLGVWDAMRRLFSATPEARAEGFKPARFSFNSASGGGRCPRCDGNGVIAHEMAFLPDVKTICEACEGQRFEPATLQIRYRGLSIGDVLRLTVQEATEIFAAHQKITRPLQVLRDLGVGYVQLGQGSHTLSGGEAQRLKLAVEMAAGRQHKPTLYVLDEPTTGLHHSDVARLLGVLDQLVQRGDSLVIIEHHPAVIAAADHLIELGPEGGEHGGRVVAQGTVEQVAQAETATAQLLRRLAGA